MKLTIAIAFLVGLSTSAHAGYIIAGDSINSGVLRTSIDGQKLIFEKCEGIDLNCDGVVLHQMSVIQAEAGKVLEQGAAVTSGTLQLGTIALGGIYGMAYTASRIGVMNVGAINAGWSTTPFILEIQKATVLAGGAIGAASVKALMSASRSLNVKRAWDYGTLYDFDFAQSDEVIALPDDSLAEVISAIKH